MYIYLSIYLYIYIYIYIYIYQAGREPAARCPRGFACSQLGGLVGYYYYYYYYYYLYYVHYYDYYYYYYYYYCVSGHCCHHHVHSMRMPSPPIKSFPTKSPRVELSGRLHIKFNGHEHSHPLEFRVCLSRTFRNPNS